MIKLSIIIVNYNGKKYLDSCLLSIKRYAPESHEIIIVDNHSLDGSIEHIKKYYPDIILIESKQNQGFSKGNNLGVRFAKGEYVLLLNNDTILMSPLIDIVLLLEKNQEIGLVGIKMLGKNNEYRLSAGFFPNALRLIKFTSLYKKNGPFHNGSFPDNQNIFYEVDWVEGSFMFIRRRIWVDIGGMDEDYFMYVEDVDLCRKIRNHGLKIVFYPYASYLHYGGYGESRLDNLVAGFVVFHKNHSRPYYQLFVKSALLFGLFTKILLAALRVVMGNKKQFKIINSYWSAIKVLGK